MTHHDNPIIRALKVWLDLALPDTCVLCQRVLDVTTTDRLCADCRCALPINLHPCPRCAQPLANHRVDLCGRCQQQPLTKGEVIAPLLYRDETQFLLQRFKFHSGWREGRVLAATLLAHVQQRYGDQPLPQLITAVPLSRRSHWQRGFNQAQVIAQFLARQLGLPYRTILTKQHTKPQRSLSRAARLQLPSNTFRIGQQQLPHHIAVVDDVMTTGSTMRVIERLLQSRRVSQVDIWCACRATLT